MVEIVELPADEASPQAQAPPQAPPQMPPPAQRPRIYLATPCYGCHMTVPYAASVLGLQAACSRNGIELTVDFIGNESLVERARNILAARFLASPCTHLLFVDADIGFRPESVLRLLQADKDVVTGVYSKKAVDWDIVKQKIEAGAAEPVIQMGLDFNININRAREEVVDGFVRVLDSATGFMLIKRGVLERMAEHYKAELACVNDIQSHSTKEYVALFSCIIDPDTRRYLSEDYSFCRRFQQMGGEIWADIASPLAHIGTAQFAGDVRYRLPANEPSGEPGPSRQPNVPASAPPPPVNVPASAPAVPRMHVAVVLSDTRREVSLMCAINLLKLQTAVLCLGRPLMVEVHFVTSTDEALNLLRAAGDDSIGSFVCASHLGFDPRFITRCLEGSHPLVLGSYPLPGIDWGAVMAKGLAKSAEPPQSWGCTFNTVITQEPTPEGYATPDRVLDMGLLWISKSALDAIVAAHPDIVSRQEPKRAALCVPGVFEGAHLGPEERFLQLAAAAGVEARVDVHHPAISSGPMEFGGCVGARSHLR